MLEALKPYTLAIKLGSLLAGVLFIFSLGSWAGCTVGKRSNASTIATLTNDKITLTTQLSAISGQIEAANAQVEANKQFAREREKIAEEAARETAKAKKTLAAKEKEVAEKIKQARKDPDCEALLEMQLCPQLRNY